MEFTLRGKPVVNRDFTWEGALNVAFFHWYYDKLDPALAAIKKSTAAVHRYAKRSPRENSTENSYRMLIPVLETGFTKNDKDTEVEESLVASKPVE